MTVEVIARHKTISEAFREYAKQRGEKLGESFPLVEHIRVIMDFQNKLNTAEIVAQRKDEQFVGKVDTDTNMRAAVDMAAAKVERQIRRKRQKAYQVPVRKSAQISEASK